MGESLSGRVAVVTGASRGIGAAIARRFAAEGAKLALVARTATEHPRLPGSLLQTRQQIEADGGIAREFVADLGDPQARADMIEAVREHFGRIDVLVNNAAANFFIPFGQISEKRRRIMFELNCHAPFDLAQRVLPDMQASGIGWILNISSRTSEHPQQPYNEFSRSGYPMLYGMSKAALERLSSGLAAELAEHNIAVNSLAPVAAVATPGAMMLYRPRRDELEGEEVMAEAALALCSCDPAQCTGQILLSGDYLAAIGREVRSLDGSGPWDGRIAGYDG